MEERCLYGMSFVGADVVIVLCGMGHVFMGCRFFGLHTNVSSGCEGIGKYSLGFTGGGDCPDLRGRSARERRPGLGALRVLENVLLGLWQFSVVLVRVGVWVSMSWGTAGA